MKRSEVKLRDKWALEDIYASDEKWEEDFAIASKTAGDAAVFRGKLGEKKELLEIGRASCRERV